MIKSRFLLIIGLCVLNSLFFLVSCRHDMDDDIVPSATPYNLKIPKFFPTLLNIPEDNPLTVEGVELGRYLFYDGRLSGRTHPDSLMSCGTCHLQSRSFECGSDHPKFTGGHPFGLTGIYTPHYMLPLINVVWNNEGYLWNGLVSKNGPDPNKQQMEDLVWMGVIAPHEMRGDTNEVKALFQSFPGYPELFEKAFGSKTITMKNINRAVSQFVRILISSDSKFDRYLRGEEALTSQELNGFVLFSTEEGGDCFHCHGGSGNPLFTTNLFYNNGLDSTFSDIRDRYHVTGNIADLGAYKATTLRNIVFTGPYMHDGRFNTLDEVINFYSDELIWSPSISSLMHHISNGGARLTPQEKADLKAFILTLTDYSFLSNPVYAKPAVFPDGWSGK